MPLTVVFSVGGGIRDIASAETILEAGASTLLAASFFHFKAIGIMELKMYLRDSGIDVRI